MVSNLIILEPLSWNRELVRGEIDHSGDTLFAVHNSITVPVFRDLVVARLETIVNDDRPDRKPHQHGLDQVSLSLHSPDMTTLLGRIEIIIIQSVLVGETRDRGVVVTGGKAHDRHDDSLCGWDVFLLLIP